MRHHYIVSYDICDPKRLRQVHHTVRDFGDALQLSVFACQLTRKDLALLESRLLDVIDQRHDQVIFVKLGRVLDNDDIPPRCRALGKRLIPNNVRVVIV